MDDEVIQCALFDFDGILFGKDATWKVIHPYAGRIGSFQHWKEACKRFETEILPAKPGTLISDYFALDDKEPSPVELKTGVNLMPMDSVTQTARSHIYRQRMVYILSARYFRGQEQFYRNLYETHDRPAKPGEFPYPAKPFENAPLLYPGSNQPYFELGGDRSIQSKLDVLLSLLSISDHSESIPPVANLKPEEWGRYRKLFLYHTEAAFAQKVEEFIIKEKGRLPDGRNAIVPFTIANLSSINLYKEET